jgi:hypothetical protein
MPSSRLPISFRFLYAQVLEPYVLDLVARQAAATADFQIVAQIGFQAQRVLQFGLDPNALILGFGQDFDFN